MPPNSTESARELVLASQRPYEEAQRARKELRGAVAQVRATKASRLRAAGVMATSPTRIKNVTLLARRTRTMRKCYQACIEANLGELEQLQKNSDMDLELSAVHGVVAVGKGCEIILSFLGVSSSVIEVAGKIKDAINGVQEGDTVGASSSLTQLLLILDRRAEALTALLDAVTDLRTVTAASLIKAIDALAKCIGEVIEFFKHQTNLSHTLKNLKVVGILQKAAEMIEAGRKAYEAYLEGLKTAGTMGHQQYHVGRLQGQSFLKAYSSERALEDGVYRNMKALTVDSVQTRAFVAGIRNASEADGWARELKDRLQTLKQRLADAVSVTNSFAIEYGKSISTLGFHYKKLSDREKKLCDVHDQIGQYLSKNREINRLNCRLRDDLSYIEQELEQCLQVKAMAEAELGMGAAP